MKTKMILLLLFVVAGNIQYLQAQEKLFHTLCYDEEFTERISVISELELSTLTILDKLKFENKKYIKKHVKYINDTGNATHDVYFVSHNNMFPEWYSHPSIIRSNEIGTKSFFTSRNEYLTDGWTGGTKTHTEHGEYVEDASTGERYLLLPYSVNANQAYQSWNNRVNDNGFLKKYMFSYPSEAELENLKIEGFEITEKNDLIRINNNSVIMAWDIAKKIFILQYVEGITPIETIKTYYLYNENFDTHLIQSVVTVIPKKFENGECYESISCITYSNYASDCDENKSSNSKSKSSNTEIEILTQLEIFPNPVTDQLTINIPKSELSSIMQITNVIGEIIIHRKIDQSITSVNLKVSELPSGVYVVNLFQGKDNYSSKFIKQ